ncbi:hypothetical protein JRQ81_016588 [Phrynocephalus forsythii]|uniref:Uncharacterized protein n=1 Tax=Phrynocephalus forsythii TaxID=171643 RepID=A0A9Q1B0Q7_9SAUR|nr:hypothetical protein JRQ81_016588 [Phrynocephalus forsythii]
MARFRPSRSQSLTLNRRRRRGRSRGGGSGRRRRRRGHGKKKDSTFIGGKKHYKQRKDDTLAVKAERSTIGPDVMLMAHAVGLPGRLNGILDFIQGKWCSSCQELEGERHHLIWQDSDAAGAEASVAAGGGGDVEVKAEGGGEDAMEEERERVVTDMVTGGGEEEEATKTKLHGLGHSSFLALWAS